LVLDDLEQVRVAQHEALEQDRPRDLRGVVRELDEERGGRRRFRGQALGELAPHGHLRLAQQLAQDVGGEVELALAGRARAVDDELADRLHDARARRRRAVAGHLEQVEQGFGRCGHGSRRNLRAVG